MQTTEVIRESGRYYDIVDTRVRLDGHTGITNFGLGAFQEVKKLR